MRPIPMPRRPSRTPSKLVLLPAVDVRDGQAVRLVNGASGTDTSYGEPLAAALAWQEAGAAVDPPGRPGRRFGSGYNRELLASRYPPTRRQGRALRGHPGRRVAARGPGHRLLAGEPGYRGAGVPGVGRQGHLGARRQDRRRPRCGRYQAARPRLDHDGGELYEALAGLDAEGCARYVVTDVDKDGMLTGPNLQLLRNVCAATDRAVVASGGVSSLQDLRDIATLVPEGVEGAIVGKAL